MSTIDEVVEHSGHRATYPAGTHGSSAPTRQLAIVACMDARLNPVAMLGLEVGDVHVIRNAGGVVTDDVIRSLTISQRLLGTREVMLIHHTDCGMLSFSETELRAEIERETGFEPPFALGAFEVLDDAVRESIARVSDSPFVPHRGNVRGFVFDVETGQLREVR